MSISTVNYQETFLLKPDLIRIIGIPTYDNLHQMQLELKSNALYVHSNLGGGTHGHLGLLMNYTRYATLSSVVYVCPVHPGILQTFSNAIIFSSYKLKRVYDKNLGVLYEVRGVEQALIQQIVTAVNENILSL